MACRELLLAGRRAPCIAACNMASAGLSTEHGNCVVQLTSLLDESHLSCECCCQVQQLNCELDRARTTNAVLIQSHRNVLQV